MNDHELTSAVRQSVEGARMDVPEEKITSRGRAIRATRRRLAAGATAIASAGAAAIATTLVLPGPAAPPAQDTAYIVSHATQALDAVPAGAIFYMKLTPTLPGAEASETWQRGLSVRTELFASGQLVSETGSAVTSTTKTSVDISYPNKTWSRSALRVVAPSAPSAAANARADGTFTCDSANKTFGIPDNASMMAASLRSWESCGWLKADGTATVGGVTAIRLTMPADGSSTTTWYVSPATYLPIRRTVTRDGTLLSTLDFEWLAPTAANLASLSLPAAPHGFTEVPMTTLP
jgi:hypothetical protein